jgi:hypothetical protein
MGAGNLQKRQTGVSLEGYYSCSSFPAPRFFSSGTAANVTGQKKGTTERSGPKEQKWLLLDRLSEHSCKQDVIDALGPM